MEAPIKLQINTVEVAIPTPVSRTFTYLCENTIAPGTRVLVPFGRRKLVGVVLGPGKKSLVDAEKEGIRLLNIYDLVDSMPVFSAKLLELARWMSQYYLHPLGEVLRTMLPVSAQRKKMASLALTEKGNLLTSDLTNPWGSYLRVLYSSGKKEKKLISDLGPMADGRTQVLGSVHVRQKIKKHLGELNTDAAVMAQKIVSLIKEGREGREGRQKKADLFSTHATATLEQNPADLAGEVIKGLKRRGLVILTKSQNLVPRPLQEIRDVKAISTESSAESSKVLTSQQQEAFDTILAQGFINPTDLVKVFLLHGVTGSGKTEVYLRLIEYLTQGQVLVLVPEISLTPQMTGIFAKRFPGKVAVVHSAMPDEDRWSELEKIRHGHATVLIGPRSAVFAPFQNLAMIIVDEEHDNSYKQTSGLAYNGRDVAVLRGKLEHAVVILGSATPSLESYYNALQGRYQLISMSERVTGRALPQVSVLRPVVKKNVGEPMSLAASKTAAQQSLGKIDIPIDPSIIEDLRAVVNKGEQAIILVNRRGYAVFMLSLNSGEPISCAHCSISMTLHGRSHMLRCHYCNEAVPVAKILADHPHDTFVTVGYGSQKAEDYLIREMPGVRIARIDSDAVTKKDVLAKTLGAFRKGEVDVLVGTQMLAKGHDFPRVTLIVILEVDHLLGLPDFRAGERTFQLMVQASGRAGRGEHPGRVLVQVMRPEHPVISAALKQDYSEFVAYEMKVRKQLSYPPFSRLIAIDLSSTDPGKLKSCCADLDRWLSGLVTSRPDLMKNVRLLGPSTPAIEKVRGYHRQSILLSAPQEHHKPLKIVAEMLVSTIQRLPYGVRCAVDVDPQSLM